MNRPATGQADQCDHARALERGLERGVVDSSRLDGAAGVLRQPDEGAACAIGRGYVRVVRGDCPGCCREVYRAVVVRYATTAAPARVIRTPWAAAWATAEAA